MPGELERLLQSVLQPARSINVRQPPQAAVTFDTLQALTEPQDPTSLIARGLGATGNPYWELDPSNKWDAAAWGEALWG